MLPTILEQILQAKAKHALIKQRRCVPLNAPNLAKPFVIAEIKRASPSAGHIGAIVDAPALALEYLKGGACALSVLCEQDYFHGSLDDLQLVKKAHPSACVLRKDFVTSLDEIKESFDCGADLVLLIVAIFMHGYGGYDRLKALYSRCLELGLTPLVEIHNQQELDFIAPLRPVLVGINSRNLHTFVIDKAQAFGLLAHVRAHLDCAVIFESAIDCSYDGLVVGSMGFDGLLCGSYLVEAKDPTQRLAHLINHTKKGAQNGFYASVFALFSSPMGFLKICGITSLEIALLCADEFERLAHLLSPRQMDGLDKIGALGFILVKHSPRFIEPDRIEAITKELALRFPRLLRVGVVNDDGSLRLGLNLYERGFLDALQLHGSAGDYFGGVNLKEANFCFYQAQNIESLSDYQEPLSPFVLFDSKSPLGGGSGVSLHPSLLEALAQKQRYLCLAGGIGIENIEQVLQSGASMIDVNSSLESEGRKDVQKIKRFFERFLVLKSERVIESFG